MSWDFLARKCNVDNLFILVLQRYFLELHISIFVHLFIDLQLIFIIVEKRSIIIGLFICPWNLIFSKSSHFQLEKKKSSLINLNFFPSLSLIFFPLRVLKYKYFEVLNKQIISRFQTINISNREK